MKNLFKTSKVLVESGKEQEAYSLLERNGIKTFNSSRFRFDIPTLLFLTGVGFVVWILISQL